MFKNYEKETLTNKSSMNNNNWLTGGDVCRILRISTRTLVNYRARGILPFAQISRKIYYKASGTKSLANITSWSRRILLI